MKIIFAIVFFAGLLLAPPSSANADGYISWDEMSFRQGPWTVAVETSHDQSQVTVVAISKDGRSISIPSPAFSKLRKPLLNEVKLLSVCCSDEVRLQIPILLFSQSGGSTKRIWEIRIVNGEFSGAAYRQQSAVDSTTGP